MARRKKQKRNNTAAPIIRAPKVPPPKPIDMVHPCQRDKGAWAKAQAFPDKPVINLAEDMIGRLGVDGKLTPQQVGAARQWQEVWHRYRAELPTQGYVSCLVERTGGYDDSDGDIWAIQAYRAMCDRIGRVNVATLKLECDKGRGEAPGNLDVLRNALDCVGG